MQGIDWTSVGQRIYTDTVSAFSQFATRHPGESCSHVCYQCDPHNGFVLLGFDTIANSLQVAKRRQEECLPHIREMLNTAPWQQEDAHRFLKSRSLMPMNLSSVDLAFQEEVIWEFPEWVNFASTDEYEARSRPDDFDRDYLRATLALCLWRVVERLDAERAFDRLPMARPCMVSYQDHDDVSVVLRVLNWPPA
jgi:hypothetical protein